MPMQSTARRRAQRRERRARRSPREQGEPPFRAFFRSLETQSRRRCPSRRGASPGLPACRSRPPRTAPAQRIPRVVASKRPIGPVRGAVDGCDTRTNGTLDSRSRLIGLEHQYERVTRALLIRDMQGRSDFDTDASIRDVWHDPTIVSQRFVGWPRRMRWPIGSASWRYCLTNAQLTIATGGALSRSAVVTSRPRPACMFIAPKSSPSMRRRSAPSRAASSPTVEA